MAAGDIALKVMLSASMGNTLTTINQLSSSLGSGGLAGTFALAGAAAVAAIGVAAVKAASDFQQSMNMVQALTGSNTAQMALYDAQIKQLAMDAGVAPNQLAQGLYNVLSASFKGADAMKVLTLATEDAKIGMTSATITTDALTNVLRAFSVQSKDITRVNGEMLQTVTLGKATFAQYASTIVKAASSAAQFHVSMETMNAAWATMTSSGIRAAQASTDFTQSLSVMYGNIGTVTKSLHANGIAFDETKFNAMDYGGKIVYLNSVLQQANAQHVHITGVTKQAAQAIQTISQHIGDYRSNLAALSNGQAMNQKTAQAWAITQNGLNQQLSRAGAAVQVLLIDIGQALLPALTSLASVIAPAVTGFLNFATAVSKNQVAVALIQASLITFAGVILAMVIPAMVAWAIGAWNVAGANIAAFWPIYLVVAIIIVVIAGVILAVKNWGAIAHWLQGVWGAIASFFVDLWNKIVAGVQLQVKVWAIAWNQIVSGLRAAWAWIINAVQAGLAFLVNMFLAPFRAIGALFSWLYNHNYYFKALIDTIVQIVTAGLAWLQNAWNTAVTWLTGLWHSLTGIATSAWNALKAAIMTVVLAIGNWEIAQWTRAVSWLSDKWHSLTGIAQSAWNAITGVFSAAWGGISGALSGIWNNIRNWFENLAKQATQWGVNLIQNLINGIKSMLGALGNAAGSAANAIKSFLGFHSPAEQGPGSTAHLWMPALIDMLASGLVAGVPKIANASNQLAVALAVGPGAYTSSGTRGGAFALSGQSTIVVQLQAADINLDKRKVGDILFTHQAREIRITGPVKNR